MTNFKRNEMVANLTTVNEILKATGLDYKVKQKFAYFSDGRVIPNTKINCIETKEGVTVLGVVTNRYKTVNNKDAFDFVDKLLDNNSFNILDAGETYDHKTVYITASLGNRYVDALNKTVECHLVFTNSHDGKGGVKVNIVPTIENAPINLELKVSKHTKRTFSANHTINVKNKMAIANKTLAMSSSYLEELMRETIELSKIKTTETQKIAFVEALFPISKKDVSDKKIENIMENRDTLMSCITENTALGFILGVSKYIKILEPKRRTKTFEEKKFMSIVDGYPLLDNAYDIIKRSF